MRVSYHGALITNLERVLPWIGSEHEPEEEEFVRNFLEPGDRTLVAGWGMGWLGMWVGVLVGPENVVGLEPNHELFSLAQNGGVKVDDKRLLVRHGALVSDSSKTYYLNPGKAWASRRTLEEDLIEIKREKGWFVVPGYTLLEAYRDFNCDCAVLDIEGAELEVLALGALQNTRKLILEVHKFLIGSDGCVEISVRAQRAGLKLIAKRVSQVGLDREFYYFERMEDS
jgi:hypothetical protein